MTNVALENIITSGEGLNIEFKQSFNKSVIETLVSFSNSKGGKVFIGVSNNGEVKGVSLTEETLRSH